MSSPPKNTGHSAAVELELIWPGGRVALGQVAPDWIMATTPCDLDPCDATVKITIDGRQQHWPVRLPKGMSRHISKTPVVKLNLHHATPSAG